LTLRPCSKHPSVRITKDSHCLPLRLRLNKHLKKWHLIILQTLRWFYLVTILLNFRLKKLLTFCVELFSLCLTFGLTKNDF
jgi:hypothetical protein